MGKKQNDIPEDINKELESPKFGKSTELTASGYIPVSYTHLRAHET